MGTFAQLFLLLEDESNIERFPPALIGLVPLVPLNRMDSFTAENRLVFTKTDPV
jgi:hypothetical protein